MQVVMQNRPGPDGIPSTGLSFARRMAHFFTEHLSGIVRTVVEF